MVILIMIMVAVGTFKIYEQTMKHSKETALSKSDKTELETLLEKDLLDKYPGSAREVVKVYLRILSLFYNAKINDEELEALAKQARILFDDELLDHNPQIEHLRELKSEIAESRKKELVIDKYKVQSTSAIQHYMKDEKEYASVIVNITMRDEQKRYKTCEEFILRKDDEGNYKILGWKLTDNVDLDEH